MIQKIKAAIQMAKDFWASLPRPAQAVIVLFASTALTTFAHAIEENFCFNLVCLKHYAASAIVAGIVAVRTFYMLPNGHAELVAKAQNAQLVSTPPKP